MTIAENTEVDSCKDIPEKYKFDSRVIRLRLLAYYLMTWYLFVEV